MQRMSMATFAALATLVFLAGCSATSSERGPVTAYEGARLIVGNGQVIDNATLVVQGEKLTQVGRSADVSVPAGAARVNLSGKTVMPTIIDTHVHLSRERDAIVRDLKQRAYYGVSAAMSLGSDNPDVLDMRGQIIPGAARFLSAGRGITMHEPGRPPIPYWISSPEEGRKSVAELAGQKVDMVKIWVDTRGNTYPKVTPEIYSAIIDEAHKRGLRVSAHIFEMVDAKGLMKAGLDAFAHGVRDKDIDDETLAMFKQRPNLILTPNLPDRGVKTDLSWLKPSLPPEEFAKMEKANTDRPKTQELFGIQARNLAKLNAAGVRITLGTDGNRPWGPHEEMEDMVAAGMTPMQVIVAATRNSAEFLRLNDAGTLQAGKSADFIVLDANPLDNITNTRRIASVILRGATVDRSQPVR